jgi:hypothetical protein
MQTKSPRSVQPDTKNQQEMLDDLDLVIVNSLLDNPDVSSTVIAKESHRPLSTIQRRRTRIERTILKKDYMINTKYAKWRSGEFFVTVADGKTALIANQIFEKYNNVTLVTTTMNNVGNLIGHIYFKDSPEMFALMEEIKKIPAVSRVMYAEHIERVGERKPRFLLEDLRK